METLRNCTKTCMEWCKNLYASVQTWAISDWNQTVADYHAACDWLCRKLKAALRMV